MSRSSPPFWFWQGKSSSYPMVLTFCTRHILFIIVTGFSSAVEHLTSINYSARLNKNWQANKIQLERKQMNYAPKIDGVCRVYRYVKVYGDTYLRTPKSGYTAHPYSVVWIHILYTSTQVRIGPDKIFFSIKLKFFLIFQYKHFGEVLKRTVSLRRFF